MTTLYRFFRSQWLIFAIGLLILLLVLISPEEKTLGAGIKIVYTHVAVTWTAMVGFGLMAVLGILAGLGVLPQLTKWLDPISWVSLGFWVLSIGLSMWASMVNWGGIPLGEPRYVATFNLLAVVVITQVLKSWLKNERIRGLLNTLPAAYFLYAVFGAKMSLHPNDPIGTSESIGIQLAFYGMFAMVLLAGVWITVRVGDRN